MRTTDESFHGRAVVSSDGRVVGEVTRLIVEPDWRVGALEIRIRRDVAERIGVHHGFLRGSTIEVSTELVHSIGDAILLKVTCEELRLRGAESPHPPAPAH